MGWISQLNHIHTTGLSVAGTNWTNTARLYQVKNPSAGLHAKTKHAQREEWLAEDWPGSETRPRKIKKWGVRQRGGGEFRKGYALLFLPRMPASYLTETLKSKRADPQETNYFLDKQRSSHYKQPFPRKQRFISPWCSLFWLFLAFRSEKLLSRNSINTWTMLYRIH